MVSKIVVFLGTLVMSFCVGKMINEALRELEEKKKWVILFIFGLIMFLIFFFRIDDKIRILSSLLCAIAVTAIEIELDKIVPL